MLFVVQIVFLLVAATGASYFLLSRRRFDFFSIGFASSMIYFLPGFFGFVRSARDYSLATPLLTETYLVFIVVLASVLAGAIVFDRLHVQPLEDRNRVFSLSLTSETALLISLVGLALTVATAGGDLFSPRKSEVMEVVGRWHMLFRFAAMYLLLFAVWRRQLAFAVAGAGLLLFDLYVGFRFGVVIASLAAGTIVLNRRGRRSLLYSERHTLLLGIGFVAFAFIYKQVYTVVKLGLWDVVLERLSDPQILLLALMNSEPFGTQTILNEVIRTGFTVDAGHIGSTAALLVPFSNLLGAEIPSFNDLFQEQLFGGVVRGGMASNIWAQFYAIGGWAGLGIIVPVYVGLLGLGSSLLSRTRGSVPVLIAIIFTFIAFYIHRNDVLFLLVLLRRSLMVWLVIVFPGMVLADAARGRVGRPSRVAPH